MERSAGTCPVISTDTEIPATAIDNLDAYLQADHEEDEAKFLQILQNQLNSKITVLDDQSSKHNIPTVESVRLPCTIMGSVIGLDLTIDEEFLDMLRDITEKRANDRQNDKASNFPMSALKIGPWERHANNANDLTAKVYYKKKLIVWEILDGDLKLKYKIEIRWSDIVGVKFTQGSQHNKPDLLEIELANPPSFHREVKPEPGKHTIWKPCNKDFTQNQEASIFRRHYTQYSPRVLDKEYEKLFSPSGPFYGKPSPNLSHHFFNLPMGYVANTSQQYYHPGYLGGQYGYLVGPPSASYHSGISSVSAPRMVFTHGQAGNQHLVLKHDDEERRNYQVISQNMATMGCYENSFNNIQGSVVMQVATQNDNITVLGDHEEIVNGSEGSVMQIPAHDAHRTGAEIKDWAQAYMCGDPVEFNDGITLDPVTPTSAHHVLHKPVQYAAAYEGQNMPNGGFHSDDQSYMRRF